MYKCLSMSYLGRDGPEACNLWFVYNSEKEEIYFLSSINTTHGEILHMGGLVGFTIAADVQNYLEIQGIQGKGYCKPVPKELIDDALILYKKKFPIIMESKIQAIVETSILFYIKISWLRLIDNTVSFGFKEEFEF